MATETQKEREAREAVRKDISGKKEVDRNPDPITGAPGSHPTGAGIGAAAGSATGAAIGAVGGPVGAVIGAVAGGIAGGYAGKGIGEMVDPTTEEAYWRDEYSNRDYYSDAVDYEAMSPAYRAGYTGYTKVNADGTPRTFDEAEADVRREYESYDDRGDVEWETARPAARDSYDRIHQRHRESNPT